MKLEKVRFYIAYLIFFLNAESQILQYPTYLMFRHRSSSGYPLAPLNILCHIRDLK